MSNLMQQRHEDLWLEDGNVVVCIEDILFKVHRSILARLSPFFLSRLSLSHDFELYDGYPLVHLEVGLANSKDVEVLLRHLYHRESVVRRIFIWLYPETDDTGCFRPLRSSSSFEHTAQILRACVQFEFPLVQVLAVDRLKSLYPHQPLPFACLNWEHVLEASQLALDCRVREVLPALMYAMVTTMDFDVVESSHEGLPTNSSQTVPQIGPELHRLCIQLMNRIMDHFAPILFTVPTSSHMECTGVFADQWMNTAIQPALDDGGVYKPLETLRKIQEVDWRSLGLCDACCEEKKNEWEDEANDIWSRVDGWLS